MVNDWEIEWNSSMIQHGVDLGTMEFIIAKGGNLSDINYVMLDQQDNSWEPLIKAVAERDNSHPDIIRKNVPFSTQQMQGQQMQGQQPYGVDRQQFRPAMPLQAGGVGTAATTPKQARQLLAVNRINQAQSRLDAGGNRGRDMAATGQRMRGLAQGTKNIATEKVGPALGAAAGGAYNIAGKGMSAASRGIKGAGRFLADKFPGAKQRMGNFMQGARDVAQHGYQGLKEYAGQVKQNYGDRQRRNVREGENTKLKDQRDRIARETGGKGLEFDRQNQLLDQSPLAQGQDARDKELRDITGGTDPETGEEVAGRLNENQAGLRDRIRDLGNQRRGTQMTPEQLQEKQKEEAKANEGTIEALNAEVDGASPEAQATANTDVAQTGTPPAPAINPEPVAPEEPGGTFNFTGEEPAAETGGTFNLGGEEPAAETTGGTFNFGGEKPEMDAERMARIQGYLGEGEKPYTKFGGSSSGQKLSQRMYDANFDPASEEDYAQDMIDAMGIPKGGHGTQLKQRLMNNSRFKAAVQQGDEETAQAIVQEEAKVTVGSGDQSKDTAKEKAPIMTFSSDKHAASWDSLMKGMNIR